VALTQTGARAQIYGLCAAHSSRADKALQQEI